MYEILKTHHCNREGLSALEVRTVWADAKLTLTAPMGATGTPEFMLRAAAVPPHPACGRPLPNRGEVIKMKSLWQIDFTSRKR